MRFLTLIVSALLLNIPIVTDAQERPNAAYQTNQFNTSAIFRQDVCERQRQYDSGEITHLEEALKGLELRTVSIISPYFKLNNETGALDEEYPRLTAVLLDELARLGQFTWRNTYAVTTPPIADKSWTELLKWSVDTYDVSIDWWPKSLDRLALGINFPGSWYDASIILVGKKNREKKTKFKFFSWLDPFRSEVWILILVTIVGSGLTYCALEKIDVKTDRGELQNKPIETIFLAGLAFTTQFDFNPRTHPARLFTFSLSFWAMLMSATYTANLASFLVIKHTPKNTINDLEGAVQSGMRLCIWGTTVVNELLDDAFPSKKDNFIIKEREIEIFEGVSRGECDFAATTITSWETYKRDVKIDGVCDLEWVGRVFRGIHAGFGTKTDAGSRCTSLIKDVLELQLFKMREQGFIEEAWIEHHERTGTIDCGSQLSKKEGEQDTVQMSIDNMLGIFILHYGFSFFAIISALFYRRYGDDLKRFNDYLGTLRTKLPNTEDTGNQIELHAPEGSLSRSTLSCDMEKLPGAAMDDGLVDMVRSMGEQIDAMNTMQQKLAVMLKDPPKPDIVPSPSSTATNSFNNSKIVCLKDQ